MNCVAYVESVADWNLSGNAWAWWDGAEPIYKRDHAPSAGAVMVFSRTRQMPLGHVAVVSAVNNPREILIDHANWHRGRVEHGTIVKDLSEHNDWSLVSVQWQGEVFGNPTPVKGFILPKDGMVVRTFHPGDEEPHLMLAGNGHERHRHGARLHEAPLQEATSRHHLSEHEALMQEAQQERELIREGQIKLASFRPGASEAHQAEIELAAHHGGGGGHGHSGSHHSSGGGHKGGGSGKSHSGRH